MIEILTTQILDQELKDTDTQFKRGLKEISFGVVAWGLALFLNRRQNRDLVEVGLLAVGVVEASKGLIDIGTVLRSNWRQMRKDFKGEENLIDDSMPGVVQGNPWVELDATDGITPHRWRIGRED